METTKAMTDREQEEAFHVKLGPNPAWPEREERLGSPGTNEDPGNDRSRATRPRD